MVYTEDDMCTFTLHPAAGELDLIPEKRSYTVEMTGFVPETVKHIQLTVDGMPKEAEEISYDEKKKAVIVKVPVTAVTCTVTVSIPAAYISTNNQVQECCFDFLNQAEISFVLKDQIYALIQKRKDPAILVAELSAMELDSDLYGALVEIITA